MGFAVIAMAAAAAVSAAGTLQAGAAQAQAHKNQAGQYKAMAAESKVQTAQEEVARRRQYLDMTGTNILDVATRDVGADSGSYEAITEENRNRFAGEVANARFIGDSRTRRYGLAARMENQAASQARTSSYFGAASTLLKGAGQAWMAGQGGGGGGGGDPGAYKTSGFSPFSSTPVPRY